VIVIVIKIVVVHRARLAVLLGTDHVLGPDPGIKLLSSDKAQLNGCLFQCLALFMCSFGHLCRIYKTTYECNSMPLVLS